MVHLGHEGEVFVIADDVPHALALIAASGDNDEGLIYALTYGDAEPVEADAGLAAFVKTQFDVELPSDALAAIKATDARLGEATRAHRAAERWLIRAMRRRRARADRASGS